MRHPYFDVETPIVIGHRGCAGHAPENTLPSFERALADGAAILESDVHVTRDGVAVLIHDDAVDRNTDGSGPVRELPLAALRRLDAGYRFTTDGGASFPFRGRGIRIPTLEEALAAFPDARFNLELKEDLAALVDATLETLARAGSEARTLLTAGDDALMARLRAALGPAPAVAQGACTGDVLSFVRAAREGSEPVSGPMALQIPPAFGGRPLVTELLVKTAHRYGVQVHVWTINEPGEMRALLDLGVDGIVTDFPGRLVDVIASRR